MELKTIKVTKEIHHKIRQQAAQEGITILQLITKIFLKYVTSLCLLLLVSCASTEYVYVDKVNMKRFQHEQKVVVGMDRNEVLVKFGSPDEAYETVWANRGAVVWVYHRKIFCAHQGTRCKLFFREGKVIYDNNFRMEFNQTVVGR